MTSHHSQNHTHKHGPNQQNYNHQHHGHHDHDHEAHHHHKHDPNDHNHDHGDAHHHHHHHDLKGLSQKRILIAFFLNISFALIELIGGLWTNSFAILSDALHDFGDALALGLGFFMERKSFDESHSGYSYGYRRYSILSAILTAIVLIVGSSFILISSIKRFFEPQEVYSQGVMLLSLLGISVNGLGAYVLSKGRSLNEKVLSWHLIEDLLGWIFVLVGGVVIYFTHWTWVDPLLAVLLSLWVIKNVIVHLKASLQVVLQATPDGVSESEIGNFIVAQFHSEVKDVHHVHCWSLDGQTHIMTCHLVLKNEVNWQQISQLKSAIKKSLKESLYVSKH